MYAALVVTGARDFIDFHQRKFCSTYTSIDVGGGGGGGDRAVGQEMAPLHSGWAFLLVLLNKCIRRQGRKNWTAGTVCSRDGFFQCLSLKGKVAQRKPKWDIFDVLMSTPNTSVPLK